MSHHSFESMSSIMDHEESPAIKVLWSQLSLRERWVAGTCPGLTQRVNYSSGRYLLCSLAFVSADRLSRLRIAEQVVSIEWYHALPDTRCLGQ
jgi:hypothetical protein